MATWDDEIRESCHMIAGALLAAASVLDTLIAYAHPDDDITIHIDTRDWLRDRANLYSPPGEPQNGYAQEGATVISLDAWREWRKIQNA